MFLKDDKSETVSSLPTENWYEWNKAKHNDVKEVDYDKRFKTSCKTTIKHISKETMFNGLLESGFTVSELLALIDANSKALDLVA